MARYNRVMFRNLNASANGVGGYILGINIDSERTLLVHGNLSGLASEKLEFPSPVSEGFQYFLSEVSNNADRLLMITKAQHLPLPDVVSVSVAGNYDAHTGILSSSMEFSQWKSESLRSQLGLRFNLPVYAENKANAGMLAELLFGKNQALEQAVYLTFTPRVRVSLLSEGRLYRNAGANTGAIGNIRLNGSQTPGEQFRILDDIASGGGLLNLAHLRHPNHWEQELTLRDLLQSALDQDPYANEVIHEAAMWAGRSLESMVHMLRPDTIIIGHPYHLLGNIWLDPMTEALSQATGFGIGQLPKIISSTLGARQPELEALSPAISALRSSRPN